MFNSSAVNRKGLFESRIGKNQSDGRYQPFMKRKGTFQKNFSSDDFTLSTQPLSQSLLSGREGGTSPSLLGSQRLESQSTPDIPLTMSSQSSQSKPGSRYEKMNKQSVVDYLSKWSQSTLSQRFEISSQSQMLESRNKQSLMIKESSTFSKEIMDQLAFVIKVVGELPEVLSNAFALMKNDIGVNFDDARDENLKDLREAILFVIESFKNEVNGVKREVVSEVSTIKGAVSQEPVAKSLEEMKAAIEGIKLNLKAQKADEEFEKLKAQLETIKEKQSQIVDHVSVLVEGRLESKVLADKVADCQEAIVRGNAEVVNVVSEALKSSDISKNIEIMKKDMDSVFDRILDKQMDFMKVVTKDLKRVDDKIKSANSEHSKRITKLEKAIEKLCEAERSRGAKSEGCLSASQISEVIMSEIKRLSPNQVVSVAVQTEPCGNDVAEGGPLERKTSEVGSTSGNGCGLANNAMPPVISAEQLQKLAKQIEETSCEICHELAREDKMLLCDWCNRGFHTDCLRPPLDEIPAESWFCPICNPVAKTKPLAKRARTKSAPSTFTKDVSSVHTQSQKATSRKRSRLVGKHQRASPPCLLDCCNPAWNSKVVADNSSSENHPLGTHRQDTPQNSVVHRVQFGSTTALSPFHHTSSESSSPTSNSSSQSVNRHRLASIQNLPAATGSLPRNRATFKRAHREGDAIIWD